MNNEKSINHIIDDIIEEFEFFDNWEDKYSYIIDMGRKLPSLDAKLKTSEAKLKGCQSTVNFHSFNVRASSDAAIVQGLLALLIRIYNNRNSEEILGLSNDFIQSTGLNNHLSITRKNGLASMINAIKLAASK